jgi:endoglucanase
VTVTTISTLMKLVRGQVFSSPEFVGINEPKYLLLAVNLPFRLATILVVLSVSFAGSASRGKELSANETNVIRDRYGGIIRGDVSQKQLALVFTGDEFGEGTEPILNALAKRRIKGAFFVTGRFLRTAQWQHLLKNAVTDGHYLGPHSNSHPLYASWDAREKSLVSEAFFTADLRKNIADLRAVGAFRKGDPVLFIPPFEQFNSDQVEWSRKLGVTLINFTPGTGSNRDYAREEDPHFVPSQTIYEDILKYERAEPHGLNGFILLFHLGSGRKDPFHPLVGPLCDHLLQRGYTFVRLEDLLQRRKPAAD